MTKTSANKKEKHKERAIEVTFFRDKYASALTTKPMTMLELSNLIAQTKANTKEKLPWLKLATFGDKRTKQNSLRNDANVLSIGGIEGDYDDKMMSFDMAVKIAQSGGFNALLYTSPSHREAEPKWRVLLPTSCDLPPEQRAKLMARLKAVFGNIFSVESDTLSQSYYYGRVKDNPDHRVVLVNGGDFIDQRDDLDIVSAPPLQPTTRAQEIENLAAYGKSVQGRIDWADAVENILEGKELHYNIRDLAASFVTSHVSPEATKGILRALMLNSTTPHDERWQDRFNDIERTVDGAEEKYSEEEEKEETTETIEPVDLWANFEAPALPRKLLPKLIEDYAFTMGETMGSDPSGLAMAALTVCSAAIPDAIKLQMKQWSEEWQEPARLWAALVGLPSFKKTPSMIAAAKALREQDHDLLRGYLYELKVYKELSAEERKSKEEPKQTRLCLEDTTIEAAQEVLEGSPNGVLLYQDELSGFFGAMDKYAGNRGAAKDRAFWLQSWAGRQYALNRVGRGVSIIPNLSISLLGGIQPDVIRKISADSHDDGFLARMLMVMARPAVMGKDVPTAAVADKYAKLIKRLTDLSPPNHQNHFSAYSAEEAMTREQKAENLSAYGKWITSREQAAVLTFDTEAQALREELERKHLEAAQGFERVNKKLAAAIGKYDGYFGRLCVLWHCIEHADDKDLSPIVTIDTASRVADFMDRFLLPHAVSFYCGVLGLADDHDHLAAVAGFILAHKLEKVTNRDIQRGGHTMRGLTQRETDAVFEQLEAFGWVTRTPGPRGNKLHWVVNPEVHVRFAERAVKEVAQRAAARKLVAIEVATRRAKKAAARERGAG